MWTYKQVYDKMSGEYIHGKVEPYETCFCFVGNLLGGGHEWGWCREELGILKVVREGEKNKLFDNSIRFIKESSEGTYTPQEIVDIEAIFMNTFWDKRGDGREEALWLAFVAGLEKIKEIHISKGEDVDQEIALPKRYEKALV